MKIGYARVSSKDQNTDRQVNALKAYGVLEKDIYIDLMSGVDFVRPAYLSMLRALRLGDVVVIKSIDRLGRSYKDIKNEFERITDLGCHVHVLDMPILNTDQKIASGLESKFIIDLILSIMSYFAEQERAFIKARQAEGIAAARKKAVQMGRPKIDPKKIVKAQQLINAGTSVNDACKIVGISKKTYYNNR